MAGTAPYRIKTISEYHRLLGCPQPQHPLVSLVDLQAFKPVTQASEVSVIFEFYVISLKRNVSGNIKYTYGQESYDFDEGVMFFIAPGQVFSFKADEQFATSGWILLIHPDLLWNTTLASVIKQYGYFGYAVNEALCLSLKEEDIISGIIENIKREYQSNIDKFSEIIIITQIETLLTYADRFYNRQFITRKKINHQILNKMEIMLDEYFKNDAMLSKGIPTVQYVADELYISPNYLSGLLKLLTGKSTLEHIQDKVIEKAKEKLSTTSMSVSEIAFELGFDYPQTFGHLFKKKTNTSPTEFRQSFN